MTTTVLPLRSRDEIEREIQRRVSEERRRLEAQAGSRGRAHLHRPVERPFTAAERDKVTILFGGLTWKHEWLIRSAFESAGYKVELLPTPDVERQIADYERRLREQLVRESELAALAAEQREFARAKKFLPVVGPSGVLDGLPAGRT